MKDRDFISRLCSAPQTVSVKEFKEKAIDGFIKVEKCDLLVSHRLAEKFLKKIVDLQLEIFTLADTSLFECNLNDKRLVDVIIMTYAELRAYGLWITGASKIAHLLNDRLFPLLSPTLARYFNISDDKTSIKNWLFRIQSDAREVTEDYRIEQATGNPEQFLSNQLGYSGEGCEKSLLKYIDEYYWLRYADCLPVPPIWTPDMMKPGTISAYQASGQRKTQSPGGQ
jgi:hypothetical protein